MDSGFWGDHHLPRRGLGPAGPRRHMRWVTMAIEEGMAIVDRAVSGDRAQSRHRAGARRPSPETKREAHDLELEPEGGHLAMKTPPIVSQQEWEAARQQLLVKEKDLPRARDALAAERRLMPWLAGDKEHEFDGPKGKAGRPDLFDGRRQ